MIRRVIPPSPSPSNSLMPTIKTSSENVFSGTSGLDIRKAYGSSWDSSCCTQEQCFIVDSLPWQITISVCQLTLSRHARSMLTYNLYQRWDDRSRPFGYRPISLISTFSRVSKSALTFLLVYLLIFSTFSSGTIPPVIFLPASLFLGHPPSTNLVNLSTPLDVSKIQDRVWHKTLISKLLLYGFSALLSVPSSLVSCVIVL